MLDLTVMEGQLLETLSNVNRQRERFRALIDLEERRTSTGGDVPHEA